MQHEKYLVLALLAASLLLPGLASAQLYQWRDTNGRVVFSDLPPPPGIPSANIIKLPKARNAPPPAAAAASAEAAAGATTTAGTASALGATAAAKAGCRARGGFQEKTGRRGREEPKG